MRARKHDIERIEINLFLDAIFQQTGYDYRNYNRNTINRRVKKLVLELKLNNVSQLTEMFLHDDGALFSRVINDFSIHVTDMFRDPGFYTALRDTVIPFLKTYPFIKIWHAGCSSGEEVYSLAILLKEEGVYDKTTIYATDINDAILKKAKSGIYAANKIKQYTLNYQQAGGKESFANYYHAQYESAILDDSLKQNITFANHNLVTDSVFSEVHLILCRNVLIYFNAELQNRVLELFRDSLTYNGFLCLGMSESIEFSNIARTFGRINKEKRIYQKNPGARAYQRLQK
ncbi:MAG TPA: protein-glutamate O-methyltransferase CheR [Gammaproteobacteria bacterium]|nr:protein-glutamate O-methyltransferase CheR [Gammaproteobacteria bacterium]